ncbi:hypothetical protein [Streptomyces canus]|uniref:hypothetical protein n=1 Tax=Streptomyces canus TaxID=58343 RepID=UPI002257AEF9|nr:hypothetical protein [Streptomyces canus]
MRGATVRRARPADGPDRTCAACTRDPLLPPGSARSHPAEAAHLRQSGESASFWLCGATGPDLEVAANTLENRLGVSVPVAHKPADEARPPPEQPWREPPRG